MGASPAQAKEGDAAIVEAVQAGRSYRDVGREFGLSARGVHRIVYRVLP